MKNLLAGFTFFCCAYTSSAQTDTTKQPLQNVVADTNPENDDSTTFHTVEIESIFPGGLPAWRDFLSKNLRYPQQAIDQKIEGTVVLQFIVCQDGTVCDIKAVSGPEILRETAIKVLKKTPNWIPAYKKGKVVRSYKKQPIVFRLGRTTTAERKPTFGMRQKTQNPWD